MEVAPLLLAQGATEFEMTHEHRDEVVTEREVVHDEPVVHEHDGGFGSGVLLALLILIVIVAVLLLFNFGPSVFNVNVRTRSLLDVMEILAA
jgi:cytoskeletal protein RodZ